MNSGYVIQPRICSRIWLGVLLLLVAASPSRAQSRNATVVGRGQPQVASLARLSFATIGPDLDFSAMGPETMLVYADNLWVNLAWESRFADRFLWRWQISLEPFPADWNAAPSLAAEGDVPHRHFKVGLASFPPLSLGRASMAPSGQSERIVASPPPGGTRSTNRRRPPLRYFIRLVPIADGKVAGPPSNVIVATYTTSPNPSVATSAAAYRSVANLAEAKRKVEEGYNVYDLAIVSFKPAVFEDPNRIGCVVVVKNPHFGIPMHQLAGFGPGIHCPKNDPAYQEKSFGQWVGTALEGWIKSYEIAGGFYSGIKGWIADKLAYTVPCSFLGEDAGSVCHDAATTFADGALSAGLASAGIPPTLPSIGALQSAAKGEIAEGAMEASCNQIESEGGHCDEAMKEGLRQMFRQGIDQLQSQTRRYGIEPHCGGSAVLSESHKIPLPCFTSYPGVEVLPASGAVYEPPVAVLRIRRGRPGLEPPPICRVHVALTVHNKFAGGTIPGSATPNYPAKDIAGHPFQDGVLAIPPLALGEQADVPVPLTEIQRFSVSQNGPVQYGTMMEWGLLYFNSTGSVRAWTGALEATSVPGSPAQFTPACSQPASAGVAIPGP